MASKKPHKKTILTKYDEGVPDTFIGLYQLFIEPEASREYFSEERGVQFRKELYDTVKKEYNKTKVLSYDKFYNSYAYEIYASGANPFSRFDNLEHLCKCIECFVVPQKSIADIYTHRVSFGIRQENVERYFKAKAEAEEKGIEFIPPDYHKAGRKLQSGGKKYGVENFIDNRGTTTLVQTNAISKRFAHWHQLQGISRCDACLMAMEAVVKLHPHVDILPLEEYQTINRFDVYSPQSKSQHKLTKKCLSIHSETCETAMQIIKRYNEHVDNILNKKWTLSSYTTNALKLLNSKVDLKYSNPAMLKEVKNIQTATAIEAESKKKGDEKNVETAE